VPTVAVLPVKSFRLGKGRMADDLPPATRSNLGRALAERVATLAEEAGTIPLIVAGDHEVAEWAIRLGFPIIPEPGTGLDRAAEAGIGWAVESSSEWLVVHTDLPLLTRTEIEEAVARLGPEGRVIAPSADGGTSALGGHGEADLSYGPGSFQSHLARFPEASILTRLGFLHDVDSIADLESARRHPRGTWLAELL
jgi:2-phospho-L-lactate guanylyltransferase